MQMKHSEFVSVYPRTHANVRIEDGLSQAEKDWGLFFGRVLHDHLTKSEIPEDTRGNYVEWATAAIRPWYKELKSRDHHDPLNTHAHVFHLFNIAMLDQWGPPSPNQANRYRDISEQQNAIALSGIQLYIARERLFTNVTDSPTASANLADLEGVLNEHDAALVLLEIQKRNPAIRHVVPAPYQFESTSPEHNVDFVMLTEDQAVGVQVKSKVSDAHRKQYDRTRVVLLDGNVDMDNVLAKKIPGKSRLQMVGWAGILCAQRLDKVPTYGKANICRSNNSSHDIQQLRFKFAAHQLVHGIKTNFSTVVNRVENRIASHLNLRQISTGTGD